ncbi:VAMP-associated protein involved in inositol metabolism [Pseudoloma neurophilia]|uniref:VAMP-associated protein involved in inositol metabolism n=1 Tax=Pseudoloma neurophilia TaxID=146866 RepID=A0A0R0M858_9MICR|nr:VAMP-associated protein involved in inositol metabolism [Pseudoloma neurophilia]
MATTPIQITPGQKLSIINGKGIIELQNDSLNGYGYKIRTTSPNAYKVEPNIGIIKPLDSLKIYVTMKDKKPGCNDKFNILIYEFDHKKSFEELKEYISNEKTPFISRILQVDNIINDKPTLQAEKSSLFLILTILMLIFLSPTLIRNFLTL